MNTPLRPYAFNPSPQGEAQTCARICTIHRPYTFNPSPQGQAQSRAKDTLPIGAVHIQSFSARRRPRMCKDIHQLKPYAFNPSPQGQAQSGIRWETKLKLPSISFGKPKHPVPKEDDRAVPQRGNVANRINPPIDIFRKIKAPLPQRGRTESSPKGIQWVTKLMLPSTSLGKPKFRKTEVHA